MNHIVGFFTHDTWATHGKRWLESANAHKGKANILVICPHAIDGVETIAYDGNIFKTLSKKDGVFLYASPNVRFQSNPEEAFQHAKDKIAVVERKDSMFVQPFQGISPVHEGYWAAPCDLIDMMYRVIDLSFSTNCKPTNFEENYISYLTEFFPWFRHVLPTTEFMLELDAELVADYYADPRSLKRLTAVSLDKPETKKVGVFAGIVKSGKHPLTTETKKQTMSDEPSSLE